MRIPAYFPFELLQLRDVEPALASLRDRLPLQSGGRGFRILAEEPELYNKWLFNFPAHGYRPRLFGLSQRFCPFSNRHYLGLILYHLELARPDEHFFPQLFRFAPQLLGLRQEEMPPGSVRGLIEGITEGEIARLEEWGLRVNRENQLMQQDVSEDLVEAERARVRWSGTAGPVWRGAEGSMVRLATSAGDVESVYQFQNCLNDELGFELDRLQRDEMYNGVSACIEYSARHFFLTLFARGAFLVAEWRGQVIGCAWCFRLFDPVRAGWIIWIRQAYVLKEHRRHGVLRSLKDAALGILAQAGYPTQLRILIGRETDRTAFERTGFITFDDPFVYFE